MHDSPKSRYLQLLRQSIAKPFPIENDGLLHSTNSKDHLLLTIDLCPSHKAFPKTYFENLLQLWQKPKHRELPVVFSISGRWIVSHERDLTWLVEQASNNKMNIIWANHSFNHYYRKDLDNRHNFLLMKGANLNLEVMANEKEMLEHEIVPSVFFRFPGLVSNESLCVR